MRAAGTNGGSLRWYRRPHDQTEGNTVIYTGEKMDHKQVDGRYFVAASRDQQEKDLVIRDVMSDDAGRYTVREVFSGQSAHANLVVVGKFIYLFI